jgi:cupin 2 domain-containing protein
MAQELVEELVRTPTARLERIVSRGHRTPDGEWYDQEWDEWVVVLAGAARLRIEGEADEVALRPGDSLVLPAHVRHRVEWTDPDADTVWLALHYVVERS